MEYFKRNFLTAEGRLNRWKYFKLMFLLGLLAGVASFITGLFFSNAIGTLTPTGEKISVIVTLAFLAPSYFLMTRRLHDIGKDNFWAKINIAIALYYIIFTDIDINSISMFDSILSFISAIIGLYILFKKGTDGYNQYGSDPLAV